MSAETIDAEVTRLGESPFRKVRERVEECSHDGVGFWRTCSGCHESEDGYDVGEYDVSTSFGCKLGGGCDECGGIGAIWDDIDYSKMGAALDEDGPPPLTFTYTNYRGETAERSAVPVSVRYGSTAWHPEEGWLLSAWDADKHAYREFAMTDMAGQRATGRALAATAPEPQNNGRPADYDPSDPKGAE